MKFGNNLGSGLGAEMQAYLDKTLLTNIAENSIFDRLATMTRGLPLRNSKEIRFDKWVRMADLYLANNLNQQFTNNVIDAPNNIDEETLQYVPANEYQNFMLEEGSSGQSKSQMKLIKQEATVFAIGDWMPFTEEMEMFHNRWTAAETSKQMGELAGLIIDGYYRDLYVNGAGHLTDISGDGSGNDNVIDSAFTQSCARMETALKLSGAKPVNAIMSASPLYGTTPVRAKYTMYVHSIVAEQLLNNPDFVPVEQYAPNGGMEGEMGIIGKLRVVENANAPLTEVSAGVYTCECIVVGKDHTAHIPVRGKGSTEFVLQALGSGGTADPLKRSGTAGWKSWLGAKVLYPERLGIIKARVNY
jgi:N4-gp56 family major capsid protein